jgi:DNA/RNA endonuclease YhcR with UshA esterase domain
LPAAEIPVIALAAPGDVVINEVVTDPQQDWSTNGFNGIAGGGSVNNVDEFIELYIKASGLDLTGWTIELLDTSPVIGSFTSGGAFQVSRYVGLGNFTSTLAGDYLVLGDVRGSGAMNNSILIVVKDSSNVVVDKVELGNDLEGDGAGDGAPDGTANGGKANNTTDEAILRYPNGMDTDNDVADFIAGKVTMGSSNDTAATPTPVPPTPIPTLPPIPGSVIINEVAWGGTLANPSDEWIELLNVTTQTITITNWTISSTGSLAITLTGTISPNDYYLIERANNGVITDTTAELTPSFGSGLSNSGLALFLLAGGTVIDTANGDGSPWPYGSGSPDYRSMERINPLVPDTDSNWASNDLIHRNGLARDGISFINGTPKQPNSTTYPPPPPPTPPPPILIGEFLYDGLTPSTEGDEFVEVCNPNGTMVDLTGYKVGDEEMSGGGESMYRLPLSTTLVANDCLVIAKNAAQFQARFGSLPDFAVADLSKYPAWGRGSWSLANNGDELVVLGPNDEVLDSVAYRNGDYATLGLEPDASAPEPYSLQRVWPTDTNSMPHDFVRTHPNPGVLTLPPSPPAFASPPAALPNGMYAYWGDLHAHTTYSDGSGPPFYALAVARAAGLHFQATTDHDWWLSLPEWAKTLTQTINATVPGQFVALRGVEWTHAEVVHINVFNTDVLLNSRTNPSFNTLPAFYTWLAANPNVIAQFNHPDPSYDGNFSNFTFHPAAARMMFMQEIGNKAQGYVTYEPSFVQSNTVGWKAAPTNNSDTHDADWGTHGAARTGLVAPALTESDLLAAMRARRVFATEDSNLAVALRVNGAWMGSTLTATGPLSLTVNVVDPDPEPLTLHLYDSNLPLAKVPLATSTGQWATTVEARPGHFFWVKVVQADGNAAYTAPVWIEGKLSSETLVINEILPAPHDWDWDGNGTADYQDEWIELYNPTKRPIGLGGWQLVDGSGRAYNIPLGGVIPAHGFATFYQASTDFSLNNSQETVTLIHPNGTVVDVFRYNHSPGYDETYCRLPDGGAAWSDNCGPSPQAANWEKAPAGPLTVKIFDAKRLTYNAWVRVKGRVTAPPGVLGARMMYIQDNTSGILIYLPKDFRDTFILGDRVEVVGNLRTFHEEFEIAVDERSEVKLLEHGIPLPPLPIATTSLLEPYEGMLVMLQGQAVDFRGRTTIWLDDGTGWAKAYIRKTTGIKKPFIKKGDLVTLVGIVSQYSDKDAPSRNDYRLLPRYQSDLIVSSATPTPPANWPALLPDTGY